MHDFNQWQAMMIGMMRHPVNQHKATIAGKIKQPQVATTTVGMMIRSHQIIAKMVSPFFRFGIESILQNCAQHLQEMRGKNRYHVLLNLLK